MKSGRLHDRCQPGARIPVPESRTLEGVKSVGFHVRGNSLRNERIERELKVYGPHPPPLTSTLNRDAYFGGLRYKTGRKENYQRGNSTE